MSKEQNIALARTAANKEGIREGLFLGLIAQESSFRADANSGEAYGIGQFTATTAPQWGLKAEDRGDPTKALPASAKYLHHLLNEFGGNEEMAVAAYNCGEGSEKNNNGVHGAIEKARNASDVNKWKNYLYPETRKHVVDVFGKMALYGGTNGDYQTAENFANATDTNAGRAYAAKNKAKAVRVKAGQKISKSEDEEDNYSYISEMMDENPIAGLLALMFAMVFGLVKGEDATELLTSFGGKSPEKRAEAEKELDKNPILKALYNKSKVDVTEGANLPTGEDIKKFNWSLLHELKGKESTIYPVKNADGSDKGGDKVITSGFGERDLDNPHASKIHPAFDFRGKAGDQVVSMFSGTVVAIGGSEHAKTVVVKNDNGTISTYMHVEAAIENGKTISAGDKIATISEGSEKYPAHLDVRTQDAKSGIYIHPQFYMDIKGMGADYKAGAITDKETVLINKKTGQTFDMAYAVQHMNDVDASVDNQVTNTDFPPKIQKLAAAAAPVNNSVVHSTAGADDSKIGKKTIEQTASVMKNSGVVASNDDMVSSLFPALSMVGKTKSFSQTV